MTHHDIFYKRQLLDCADELQGEHELHEADSAAAVSVQDPDNTRHSWIQAPGST